MNAVPRFKAEPVEDRARLAYIRTLNCCVCYAPPPSEAAHIRMGLGGGMGMKSKDAWTLPMCHDCHAKSHRGAGEVAFWREEINGSKCLLVSILRGYAESLKPVVEWDNGN